MPKEGEPLGVYGNKLYKWMESAEGDCPVKQCTLIVDDFTHEIFDDSDVIPQFYSPSATHSGKSGDAPAEGVAAKKVGLGPYQHAWTHVGRMNQLFGLDLQTSNGEEFQPTYYVEKSEDWKFQFRAEEREAKAKEVLETYPGGYIPVEDETPVSWKGVVSKSCIVINWMKRNHDQPSISDVTNAIYTHLMSEHELKYVFVHDVENVATEKYITAEIFSEGRGLKWPPEKNCQLPFDTSEEHKKYYMDLLGTPVGRTVGHLVLGRYPRGSCMISEIQISVSDVESDGPLRIDMMFVLKATKPAHGLKQAKSAIPIVGAKGGPEGQEPGAPAAPAAGKPLELAVAAAGPMPPAGGKPIGPAIALAKRPIDQKTAYRKNRDAILKRKADELQAKENDQRYCKTRSGKVWKTG